MAHLSHWFIFKVILAMKWTLSISKGNGEDQDLAWSQRWDQRWAMTNGGAQLVHNLVAPDSKLKAHLWEETNTIKEPNHSGNSYSGNQVHIPKNSPHNLNLISAANIGISMHKKFGASWVFPSTNTIGVNPINALNQLTRGNQFQAVAQLKPSAQNIFHNSLSREEHKITRAQKKPSTCVGVSCLIR